MDESTTEQTEGRECRIEVLYPDGIPMLHIYAQHCEHAEASIVGNAPALKALAAAIGKALTDGEADSDAVFVDDGEGYHVNVRRSEIFSDLPTPYRYQYISDEVQQWRERAFKAEIALSRLRKELTTKRPPDAAAPLVPTPSESFSARLGKE